MTRGGWRGLLQGPQIRSRPRDPLLAGAGFQGVGWQARLGCGEVGGGWDCKTPTAKKEASPPCRRSEAPRSSRVRTPFLLPAVLPPALLAALPFFLCSLPLIRAPLPLPPCPLFPSPTPPPPTRSLQCPVDLCLYPSRLRVTSPPAHPPSHPAILFRLSLFKKN